MTNTYGDDPFDECDYENLTEAKVAKLPECNFCSEPALYDFKTKMGPWAFGCQKHFDIHRLFDTLGTGRGQKLVVEEECLLENHGPGGCSDPQCPTRRA